MLLRVLRVTGGAASLMLPCGSVAAAQRAECPPVPAVVTDTTAFLPCQVAAPARALHAPAPEFPAMLFFQGVSGSVLARFVVDTTGRGDVRSLRVLESSHELFSNAVRDVIAQWRFQPAHRDGRPVRVRWEWQVAFLMPPDDQLTRALGPDRMHVTDSSAAGRWRTTIDFTTSPVAGPVRDPLTARRAHLAAAREVLAQIQTRYAPRRPLIVCVSPSSTDRRPVRTAFARALFADTPVELTQWDAASLDSLSREWLAVVDHRRCPRSFASWVVRVDSLGRRIPDPPGHDPIGLTVTGSRRWDADRVLVGVAADRTEYLCVVSDAEPPSVRCTAGARWMH